MKSAVCCEESCRQDSCAWGHRHEDGLGYISNSSRSLNFLPLRYNAKRRHWRRTKMRH